MEPTLELKNPKVSELIQALRLLPQLYNVFVSYGDSLYAVTDVSSYSDNDDVSIESEDARGTDEELIPVEELIELLEEMPVNAEVFLSPAENLDPELDMQMDECQDIAGLYVNDVCCDVYIVAA